VPGELQCEAARPQSRERLVDIGGDAFIDLADEAQRQLEIAGIDPSRARDHGFEHRQMQFQLGGNSMPTNRRSIYASACEGDCFGGSRLAMTT
jgi:hypothetical protein